MGAGRPTDYTPEKAQAICELIVEGESIRDICARDDMPSKSTLFLWLETHAEFRTIYARAKDIQIEAEADEIVAIADDGRNDWMEKHNADGESIGWRENGEAIRRSALRVATRQWRAERLLPKVYGSKIRAEHTGKDGGPIEVEDTGGNELARRIAFILAKGMSAQSKADSD